MESDAKNLGSSRPNFGGKVCTPIAGKLRGYAKTGNTVRDKGCGARQGRCVLDRGCFGPAFNSIDRGKKKSMFLWWGQGANEIDVDMVKSVSIVSGYGSQGALTWRCTLAFWQPHSALPTSRPVCGDHAKRTLKQSTFALFELKDVKVYGWHQKLVCAMRGGQWAQEYKLKYCIAR